MMDRLAVTAALLLAPACTASGPLTDDDVTRVCELQVRCGGGAAMPDCATFYDDVRRIATSRGCGDALGAQLRCYVQVGACAETGECLDEQRAYEGCSDAALADAGS